MKADVGNEIELLLLRPWHLRYRRVCALNELAEIGAAELLDTPIYPTIVMCF